MSTREDDLEALVRRVYEEEEDPLDSLVTRVFAEPAPPPAGRGGSRSAPSSPLLRPATAAESARGRSRPRAATPRPTRTDATTVRRRQPAEPVLTPREAEAISRSIEEARLAFGEEPARPIDFRAALFRTALRTAPEARTPEQQAVLEPVVRSPEAQGALLEDAFRTRPDVAGAIGPRTISREYVAAQEAERIAAENRRHTLNIMGAVRPGLPEMLAYGRGGMEGLTFGNAAEIAGALTPGMSEEDFEPSPYDRPTGSEIGAGIAGQFAGTVGAIGSQNALLARAAPLAAEGSALRAGLQSFGRTGARSRIGDAIRGAAEGVPYDLLYDYENPDDRLLYGGLGVVGGAAAGAALRMKPRPPEPSGFVRPSSRRLQRGSGAVMRESGLFDAGRDAAGTAGVASAASEPIILYHGSGNPAMALEDVRILGRNDQTKQGKPGRTYGGFYAVGPEKIDAAENYARMMGGTPTVYEVRLKPGTRILDLERNGQIERLSETTINDLVAQGYGAVRGKNILGTTTEYAVINRDAIEGLARRDVSAPAAAASEAPAARPTALEVARRIADNGRRPTVARVAQEAGVSEEEAREAVRVVREGRSGGELNTPLTHAASRTAMGSGADEYMFRSPSGETVALRVTPEPDGTLRTEWTTSDRTVSRLGPETIGSLDGFLREYYPEAVRVEGLSDVRRGAPLLPAPPPRVEGVDGQESVLDFPDGTQMPVRYRVVEADAVRPSHDALTFQQRADYPEGVQGRDYHRDRAAQERVAERTARFDPERVLDPTRLVSTGPPTMRSDGVAVAGNERTMLVQRLEGLNPQARAAYRAALEERAPQFGIDPEQIRGMRNPILVREMQPREGVDLSDTATLRDLNTRSDESVGKVKDVLSDAATRARQMQGGRALAHFAETMQPEQTLRDYLGGADGRRFVRELVEDGVIPRSEAPRYIDARTGALNGDGTALVERTLYLSAIPDTDILDAAPASLLQQLEPAIPALVQAAQVPGWDLGPVLRDAAGLFIEARGKGLRGVDDLLANTEMFGRDAAPGAEALARFLARSNRKETREVLSQYARMARLAQRMQQSDDLFGELPPEQAETFRRLLGDAGFADRALVNLLTRTGAGAAAGGAIGGAVDQESPGRGALLGALAGAGLSGVAPALTRAVKRWLGQPAPRPPRKGEVLETPGGRVEVLDSSLDRGSVRIRLTPREPGEAPREALAMWDSVLHAAAKYEVEQVPIGRAPDTAGPLAGTRVADPQGRPRVVYQDNAQRFGDRDVEVLQQYQPGLADDLAPESTYGPGYYFTESKGVAGKGAHPARLLVRNPFREDLSTPLEEAARIYRLAGLEEEADELADQMAVSDLLGTRGTVPRNMVWTVLRKALGRVRAGQVLREAGYDGVTFIGTGTDRTGPHRVWVAFDKTQIHSARSDAGAADPTAVRTLAGVGVGAAAGAATDEQDPLRGAIQGAILLGTGSAVAPAAIRSALRVAGNRVGAFGDPRSFYSRLDHALRDAPQDRATPQQWLAYLQQRTSKGEREWTGVDAFLANAAKEGRPVTREQLRALYDENAIRLEEVVRGEAQAKKNSRYAIPEVTRLVRDASATEDDLLLTLANDGDAYRALMRRFPELRDNEDWAETVAKDVFGTTTNPVKYGQYQLPGAENYREVLVTLGAREKLPPGFRSFQAPNGTYGIEFPNGSRVDGWTTEEEAIRSQLRQPDNPQFRSSHWEEPNVLLHLRMNDRTLPNGERVLFVEELQSDWHQKGRKEGYRSPETQQQEAQAAEWAQRGREIARRLGAGQYADEVEAAALRSERDAIIARLNALPDVTRAVPDAPFKRTEEWLGLGMKRVLDEAAAGGYDRVAWATGAQQAERYDLSKHVSRLVYNPATRTLEGFGLDGQMAINRTVAPEQLPDVVGKEVAQRLLDSEPKMRSKPGGVTSVHELSSVELQVGGEGMKAFYDRMIPNWVRDYGKKLGVRIEVEPVPIVGERVGVLQYEGPNITADQARALGLDEAADLMEGSPPRSFAEVVTAELETGDAIRAARAAGGKATPREQVNPSFRVTPELREAVRRGQPLGFATGSTTATIASAGIGALTGAALDDEQPLRGALAGLSIGAGGVVAIRHGKVMGTVGRLRAAERTGRLRDVLAPLDDGQVETLAKRIEIHRPQLASAMRAEIAERIERASLTPAQQAERDVELLARNVLAPVRARRPSLATPEREALLETFQQAPRELRHRIIDELESALEEVPAAAQRHYERLIEDLERTGYGFDLPAVARPEIDPEQFVRLSTFVADPQGQRRLADHVARIVDAEGLDPKRRITWDETRQVARELGLEGGDVAFRSRAQDRLGAAEMLAIRNQVSENLSGIEWIDRQLAEGAEMMGAERRRTLEMARAAAEDQNSQLLSRFIRSRSATGRDLNALKMLANQGMDPVVWTARVKKILEDRGQEFNPAVHGKRVQEIIRSCG